MTTPRLQTLATAVITLLMLLPLFPSEFIDMYLFPLQVGLIKRLAFHPLVSYSDDG